VRSLGAAKANAQALQYLLLDYHGGLADLRARVLRSPTPAETPLEGVWREVIGTPEERVLAARVGIGARVGPGLWACGETVARAHRDGLCDAVGACDLDPSGEAAARNLSPEDMEAAMLQAVWWVKVLRDDPLRVLRTLRFACKLDFSLHGAFWAATPFALPALRSKVSGSRKATELRKVAELGLPQLLRFMELSFGVRMHALEPDNHAEEDLGGTSLAPALFAGCGEAPHGDGCGVQGLGEIAHFDAAKMRAAAAALPDSSLQPDERLGAVLAAAVCASTMADDVEAEAEVHRLEDPLPPTGPNWDDVLSRTRRLLADSTGTPPSSGAGELKTAAEVAAAEAAVRAVERTLKQVWQAQAAEAEAAEAEAEAADSAAHARLQRALVAVRAACDGLRASSATRHAAEVPLACASALLEPPPPPRADHALFGAAVGAAGAWPARGGTSGLHRMAGRLGTAPPSATEPAESAAAAGAGGGGGGGGGEFGALVRMWRVQKLDPRLQAKQPFDASDFAVALARAARCAPATAARLEARLALLRTAGPRVSGGCFEAPAGGAAGGAVVPAHLRADTIAHLQVLCRLRGVAPRLETPADLEGFLDGACGGLLAALKREWYADDDPADPAPENEGGGAARSGALRPEYAKGGAGREAPH